MKTPIVVEEGNPMGNGLKGTPAGACELWNGALVLSWFNKIKP